MSELFVGFKNWCLNYLLQGFIQDLLPGGILDSMYFSTCIVCFALLRFVVEFYLAVVL